LQEQHRIFHARDMKKIVALEMSARFSEINELKRSAFFTDGQAVLPICDFDRAPPGWLYVSQGQGSQYLSYRGHHKNGAQFLSWGEGNWIRLSSTTPDFEQEGMACEQHSNLQPDRRNYVRVILDRNILNAAKRKNQMSVLSHAVLQVHTRVPETQAKKMRGEVTFSSAPVLESGSLMLELWEKRVGDWQLLTSTTAQVNNGYRDMTTWVVEANATPGSEMKLTMRVAPKGRDTIVASGHLAHLYLYGAKLVTAP
jgi:hypothetical protein